MALIPRTHTPDMEVSLTTGGHWRLSERSPQHFTMVVVYRGLHCPICKTYLADLNRNVPAFTEKGVEIVALSCDPRERAETAKQEWQLDKVEVGYGLTIDSAREWGMYISTSRGKTSLGIEEPELFAEPGMFIVRPDRTLYAAYYATMPFARPHFKEVLGALEFIINNDYPARGEA